MNIEFPLRLQSFIAKSTTLSRRKAEEAIVEGRVEVNDAVVTKLGTKVERKDKVYLDGEQITLYKRSVVYMLNKPRGSVCTNTDPHQKHYARDFIDTRDHDMLFSVGRLDKDSQGLVLFTTDGELANRIIHPTNKIRKHYSVNVTQKIEPSHLEEMKKGILFPSLSAYPYRIEGYTIMSSHWVEVVLCSGKNREIRKLFENFGYTIEKLIRTRIGGLDIGELKEGKFKKLSQEDIERIFDKSE